MQGTPPCRGAGGTGIDVSVFPLLLSSLQACLPTRPSARSHWAEAPAHPPREQGPFSACHPIAMTQFPRGTSQPRLFPFCLCSHHSPPSPSPLASDIYFQTGRDRGGFSLRCPRIVPRRYLGTSVTLRGAGGTKPPAGNGTAGGRIGYPRTQGIQELFTAPFLGRAFSAPVSLRLGFVP